MGPYALQDPVVFATVEDWFKLVVPHLFLTGCIEIMKIGLSSGHLVMALAFKRCSRQQVDHEEYRNQRHTTHLYTGCSHKWDFTSQVQGNPLAALGC